MEETGKKSVKGLRIRTLNYIMIFISCILCLLLIFATNHASKQYENSIAATDNYISCQKNTEMVTEGSDYLTEQVQLYVITMQIEYMHNYFTEVNETRRREKALSELEKYPINKEAVEFIRTAIERSNELMESEIYAMKLIALSQGAEEENLPKEVQETELSADDQLLTPEEMVKKARNIIFASSYQDAKSVIINNISYFIDTMIDNTHQKQQTSFNELKQTMKRQQILISILFLLNVITFITVIILIIKPLHVYIKCIKEEKQLKGIGSYEFRNLASIYNNICEINAAHEAFLRHRAEHDPLTGIMNRGTFDELKQYLKVNPCALALLIIDIDNFKQINDGYGHEVGDEILKKVAKLIKESFRSNDYPARIGGDEFAVIVTEIMPEMKTSLLKKAAMMNEILKNPSDDLPPVSLSIGIAFGKNGFADDLYTKADRALYIVKENGRCGCRIYEEEGSKNKGP